MRFALMVLIIALFTGCSSDTDPAPEPLTDAGAGGEGGFYKPG